MTPHRDIEDHLRWPALGFLVVTLLLQVADLIVTVSPMAPTKIMWRFNALGSAASTVGNVLLLILLLFAVSLLFRMNTGLALVALLSGLVAIGAFLGAGIFILDTLQLSGKIDPQVVNGFATAASQALWRLLVNGLIAGLFTFSSLKAWRARARPPRRDSAAVDGMLVVRGAAGSQMP